MDRAIVMDRKQKAEKIVRISRATGLCALSVFIVAALLLSIELNKAEKLASAEREKARAEAKSDPPAVVEEPESSEFDEIHLTDGETEPAQGEIEEVIPATGSLEEASEEQQPEIYTEVLQKIVRLSLWVQGIALVPFAVLTRRGKKKKYKETEVF